MRPESLYFLFSPITRIKGVGGATAKALERLLPPATAIAGNSMPIIRDLLFHLPVSLLDRRFTCPLSSAPDGVIATFVVTIDSHLPPPVKRFGKRPYKVVCSNDTGDITLVFFNASDEYIKNALPVGSKRVISGRTEHFEYRLQMTHPDIIAPVEKLAEVQKPYPVYPLTVGLTSRRIARIVEDAIAKLPELPEWTASEWLAAHHWLKWKAALHKAHHPESDEELLPAAPARQRLAYDEILANQLHLALLRRHMQQQAGEIIKGTSPLTEALLKTLPFKLTHGQEQVLKEIHEDLASGKRMGRLLQGDVGSGKTIVALLAMLRAAEQGLQSALMVPTEIIAQQHFETISRLLTNIFPSPLVGEGGARERDGRGDLLKKDLHSGAPLSPTLPHKGGGRSKVVLLTGSVKGRPREQALADIASGAAQIIIGTHALFQEKVAFKNLALVVIDEQHRFGVGQRMALSAKGDAPHLLHLTATPIPRSLTMTLYGDMDCSLLKEKPAERLPITTRVIPLSRYEEIMERLKAALDKGEKVYWICPFIEDSGFRIQDSGSKGDSSLNPESRILAPEEDIAAVQSRFTEFKARFGKTVGLVHGRMKADERDEQMRKFTTGETRLLVATTVVEVGIDVRDATIMIIEKAERFGLSQLHQLRGRVGRGDKQSACVLLYSDYAGEIAQKRLSLLRETEDGFRIAEADLAIRGGGDLLGSRQSGMPRFIFTDLFLHRELLEHARDDIHQFLKADPNLASERGHALSILLQLFGYECHPERA